VTSSDRFEKYDDGFTFNPLIRGKISSRPPGDAFRLMAFSPAAICHEADVWSRTHYHHCAAGEAQTAAEPDARKRRYVQQIPPSARSPQPAARSPQPAGIKFTYKDIASGK
jgi:hypothetical protein